MGIFLQFGIEILKFIGYNKDVKTKKGCKQ